jgi:predicted SprT family Zn-dependent metalloprotease
MPRPKAKTEKEILELFRRFNRRYFRSCIPAPRVFLSSRLKRAGQVDYNTWQMDISPSYHDAFGWGRELERTVKHEMIHLYLYLQGRDSNHTEEFRKWCEKTGAFFYCRDYSAPDRYLYACPNGHQVRSKRRMTAMSCSRCDAESFNPRFRLVMERVLRRAA